MSKRVITKKRLVIECTECLNINPIKDYKIEENMCNECFEKSQKYAYRYYLKRGYIQKDFYENYLRDDADKNTKKILDEIFKKYEEECLSIYGLGLKDSYNRSTYYSTLFCIENGNNYLPILVEDINTSSCMALEMCSIYVDDDEEIFMTIEEILDLLPTGYRKSVKKVIESEKINSLKKNW